jgi:hypothetical protein
MSNGDGTSSYVGPNLGLEVNLEDESVVPQSSSFFTPYPFTPFGEVLPQEGVEGIMGPRTVEFSAGLFTSEAAYEFMSVIYPILWGEEVMDTRSRETFLGRLSLPMSTIRGLPVVQQESRLARQFDNMEQLIFQHLYCPDYLQSSDGSSAPLFVSLLHLFPDLINLISHQESVNSDVVVASLRQRLRNFPMLLMCEAVALAQRYEEDPSLLNSGGHRRVDFTSLIFDRNFYYNCEMTRYLGETFQGAHFVRSDSILNMTDRFAAFNGVSMVMTPLLQSWLPDEGDSPQITDAQRNNLVESILDMCETRSPNFFGGIITPEIPLYHLSVIHAVLQSVVEVPRLNTAVHLIVRRALDNELFGSL